MDHVPLENNGSPNSIGSHWEKLFFNDELMNPTANYPLVISGFSSGLLVASGWYNISSDFSGQMYWGRG
jgi:hypothetical protein